MSNVYQRGVDVLPCKDGGDVEDFGEFALASRHATEGNGIFARAQGAGRIEDGDFADGGQLGERRTAAAVGRLPRALPSDQRRRLLSRSRSFFRHFAR